MLILIKLLMPVQITEHIQSFYFKFICIERGYVESIKKKDA